MDSLLIENGAGPLSVVGRLHTDRARPSLVAVNGAFPPREHLHDLVEQFRGANVLVINQPGMAGTPWSNPTVAEATEALRRLVARLIPRAPIVALGVSTGNLLTLGLELPNLRRRIALEPFFQTRDLWPFIANSRERMTLNPGNAAMVRYFWEVFGIAPERVENRDYRHLLDAITVPTDVILGALPLMPERETATWPSFTGVEDRAALAANPLVRLHEGPADSGHNHGSVGPSQAGVRQVIHAALRELVADCQD